MSNAAHLPAPTTAPVPMIIQRGGMAPTQAKMDFYFLQNHFWQLDAAQRFTGTETRLYFYWLNRFNAGLNGEYWPAEYPRFGKQVEADLGLTDKTLAAARKALVKRGLLSYKEGSKSRAAMWSLPRIASKMSRNNSGESDINRNYSEQSEGITPNMPRNDSGQSGAITPNMSRNNSGLYKEKTKTSSNTEDKDSTLPADAVARTTELKDADDSSTLPKKPTSQVIAPTFDEFWTAYDKKLDQHKCRQRWRALTVAEQLAALAHVPHYVAATKEKRFRKNPLSYLNGRCWLDEETPEPAQQVRSLPYTAPAPSRASTTPSKAQNWS